MFRKYQLAIWLSIQNFYSHFTKVTRKCECFGRIVEPRTNIIYKPYTYNILMCLLTLFSFFPDRIRSSKLALSKSGAAGFGCAPFPTPADGAGGGGIAVSENGGGQGGAGGGGGGGGGIPAPGAGAGAGVGDATLAA